MISSIICRHTHHLFQSPWCNKQTLIRRICNLVFHILTLGIPLLLYFVVSFCLEGMERSLLPGFICKYGQEAVILAKRLLLKYSFQRWKWYGNVRVGLLNKNVDTVVSLYWERSFRKFKKALQDHPIDSWNHENVIMAADELLKIGYALSESVWMSLPWLKQKLSVYKHGDDGDLVPEENIDIALDEDLYVQSLIHYCAYTYTWIRYGVVWDDKKKRFVFPNEDIIRGRLEDENLPAEEESCIRGLPDINAAFIFYYKGSIQNRWRLLYNEYCDRFLNVLNLNEDAYIKDFEIPQKDCKQGHFYPMKDSFTRVISSFNFMYRL